MTMPKRTQNNWKKRALNVLFRRFFFLSFNRQICVWDFFFLHRFSMKFFSIYSDSRPIAYNLIFSFHFHTHIHANRKKNKQKNNFRITRRKEEKSESKNQAVQKKFFFFAIQQPILDELKKKKNRNCTYTHKLFFLCTHWT